MQNSSRIMLQLFIHQGTFVFYSFGLQIDFIDYMCISFIAWPKWWGWGSLVLSRTIHCPPTLPCNSDSISSPATTLWLSPVCRIHSVAPFSQSAHILSAQPDLLQLVSCPLHSAAWTCLCHWQPGTYNCLSQSLLPGFNPFHPHLHLLMNQLLFIIYNIGSDAFSSLLLSKEEH